MFFLSFHFQLLDECKQIADTLHDTSEVSEEAVAQSFDILNEKSRQRSEANLHPFVITQPVAFSEEMFSKFDSSPTARIYLQAFKLVKEGFKILFKSNFKEGRGITLIAYGFLTENSILQAFPITHSMLPQIFQLCEKNLQENPCFFEGLVISFAMHHFERNLSVESSKVDAKKVMCIKNLICLIQEVEPNSPPTEDPFSFDENYGSWLHVLYYHLAALYVVSEAYEKAAEAFENSLKCCPSYFDSKRGLGYCLVSLHGSKLCSEEEACSQGTSTELLSDKQKLCDREISKYASWTTKELEDTAEKILKEYLAEAPPCWKTYPNACYYLAYFAFVKTDMKEFRKYYELGQDAEAKRLPFLEPVNLPLKDDLSSAYQLLANVPKPIRCGNTACTKKVTESELKFCARCRDQKYCSK